MLGIRGAVRFGRRTADRFLPRSGGTKPGSTVADLAGVAQFIFSRLLLFSTVWEEIDCKRLITNVL